MAAIRAAILAGDSDDRDRNKIVGARIRTPPQHPLPARAAPAADALAAQLVSYLEAQSTGVIEAASAAEIPAAAAKALAATGLAPRLRTGSDKRLSGLAWQEAGIVRVEGAATPQDAATLSHAAAGVAETGTLVLDSGPDNPTSLAFLPELHLVALALDAIVGSYEEAFAMVRAEYGKGQMPRALNFISGASRTGDIGGRIVKGAHGPRAFCVILYGRGGGAS